MSLYYSPIDGLEIFGTVEDEEMCCEFDMFVIWQDKTGQLYYASDSGCSCPSPFEDYNDVSDLSYGTVAQVHEALDAWNTGGYSHHRNRPGTADMHARLAML
jgi:hypothetical protein